MRRRTPASLVWLGGLVALAVGAALVGGGVMYLEVRRQAETRSEAGTRGSVAAGEIAIGRYGCGSCHVIASVAGANGMVGPDLSAVSKRVTIAGRLPNEPEAMVRWLMHPQRISPGSGMPEQGVIERDARDMAAFLYARD